MGDGALPGPRRDRFGEPAAQSPPYDDGAGDDQLSGQGGGDTLYGGEGDDQLEGDQGVPAYVERRENNDRLYGDSSNLPAEYHADDRLGRRLA